MSNVLVIIPVHNEATTIAKVVTETLKVSSQVLVVNDGSKDSSQDRARKAGAIVVDFSERQGYSKAIIEVDPIVKTKNTKV
ncbi:MAG: glycosyltransferase [Candidatus Hodarchaeota archaeon]